MDLSAVLSVVKTIGNLITEEARLLGGKDQVESSLGELKLMRSFLKEADSRKRELAYDAEDVIETFAPKVTLKKKGGISNAIKRSACFLKEGRVLHETKSKIEKITARIKELTRELRTYNLRRLGERGDSSSSTESTAYFKENKVDAKMEELGKKALFHQQRGEGNGGEMMEDVAEGCLVELVERCMVQVGERGPTLKIKTYRMHDLMRVVKAFLNSKMIKYMKNIRIMTIAVYLWWSWVFFYFGKGRDVGHTCSTILNCLESWNVKLVKMLQDRFLNLRAFDFIIPKIPSSLGNLRKFNTYNCFLADRSKFTKLRKLEIFGSLHIEDCKEGLDKNLSIITSKYLQSLSIDGGGIDPKLLVFLLSSCVYLCELILDGKMRMLPEYHRFPSSTAYATVGASAGEDFHLIASILMSEWVVTCKRHRTKNGLK
ncbi:hypothetical protein GOBAR_DD28893 [Gossypium barbadense]|nr:hypothetical protein GOBAR_DD28893 [Gossypium barbadense]